MRLVAAFVMTLALLLIPAQATAAPCAGWNEFVHAEPAVITGWHRARVINHFDVQPNDTVVIVGSEFDRRDQWRGARTCADGPHGAVITMYYKRVHHNTFSVHDHLGMKCYVDGDGGHPDNCWR